MRRIVSIGCSLCVAMMFAACGAADTEGKRWEDLLVPGTPGGKMDTAYLSDLATEVEAVLTSEGKIDVRDKSQSERDAILTQVQASEGNEIKQLANGQLKFAKNEINEKKLHMNLTSSKPRVLEATLSDDGFIHVRFEAIVESTVTQVDLDKMEITLPEFLETAAEATVPDQPTKMYEAVGDACIKDGSHAASYNYFYYFEADKEGCAEAMESAGIAQVRATFELRNLAPAKTVYPEYDQLVDDGLIEVVAFFGAAKSDWEPGTWDWGPQSEKSFIRDMKDLGFREVESADTGLLLVRTNDGLETRITVIGPETLKLLNNDVDGLFTTLVKRNEIIFYNGHSFYGSLNVLDNPEIYPGRYQIFFMNSCWSYEYYTKQIFEHNVTADDPTGWDLADVVNDTESGWFHNMADESTILLSNLLRGAETMGVDEDRYFTWDRIIAAMNQHAIDTYYTRHTETHEIYGVSGVRTNRFEP